MSKIESDRNDFARVAPRQRFSGKMAAIFFIVGPPIFGPLFYLACTIASANGVLVQREVGEAVGMVFSFTGIGIAYLVGFVPSLITGFAYSRSYHLGRTIGRRLLLAALIGAAVYFLVCTLVLYFLYAGRIDPGAWPFTAYAAGSGAVSAFVCALIVDIL